MRDIAGSLIPAPDAWHGTKPVAMSPRLEDATFVFVRRDASHGPLQTPYTGPYRVLERHEKHYKIQCGVREETVSVDRLKPAYEDPGKPLQAADPPRRGRPPKQRNASPVASKKDHESGTPAPERQQDKSDDEPEQEANSVPPTYAQVTRSGRQVRQPQRYGASRVAQDKKKDMRQTLGGSPVASPKGVTARLHDRLYRLRFPPDFPARFL